MTRTPTDRPARVPPAASAGPATSPASHRGGVAASGLPVPGLPMAGGPDATKTPAAGENVAASSGKGLPPRPAAGNHLLAAAMSEDELEEHVRAICKDVGVLRIHVYNSRGTTPGVPDDVLVGPRGILWRECKTMRGKLSIAQQSMGEALTAAGQDWGTWRPADLLSGRIAQELIDISRIGRAA